MIIYMSDILCVTNRTLCREAFLARIEKIAAAHPAGIILREKDLTEEAYRELAVRAMALCEKFDTPCILHNFTKIAIQLKASFVHLPLPALRTLSPEDKRRFQKIGSSCHSVEEALEAQRLGCNYILAGHIFDTDCKKGLPGRGLDFLESICKSVSIPVYAIGGIGAGNIRAVRKTKAAGACVMSGLMTCEDAEKYLLELEEA